jgi:hypothetical protein
MSGINVDITEQKAIEEKLRQVEIDLLSALEIRDEFFAIASHELKTPLTSLKLQIQLYERAIMNNESDVLSRYRVEQLLQRNHRQTLRLGRLVDDMLDISRIKTGRLTLKREICEINQIIRDIVARNKEQFLTSGSGIPEIQMEGRSYGHWDPMRNEQGYMDATLLGIGERSGITSLTALLFNLYIDKAYDYLEGYHLRGSYPINVMFASKLRKLVPSKEPVSLTNRTHTAGVHQKALLNDATTYEAFPLDQFGVNESEVLLGPLSGWNIIHYFLKEIKGYNLGEGTARQIAAAFKERVYNLGPQDSPTEILVDIAENQFGLSRISVPERFKDNILQRMDTDDAAKPQPGPSSQSQAEELRGSGEVAETYGREAAVSLKR